MSELRQQIEAGVWRKFLNQCLINCGEYGQIAWAPAGTAVIMTHTYGTPLSHTLCRLQCLQISPCHKQGNSSVQQITTLAAIVFGPRRPF